MIFLLFLIVLGITLAVARDLSALRMEVVVLMLLVSLFHPILTTYPLGLTSNFGNAWYTAVLAIMAFLTITRDHRLVLDLVFCTLTVLAMVWLILLMVAISSPYDGEASGAIHGVVRTLAHYSLTGAGPSWLAFFAASGTVMLVAEQLRPWGRVVQFLGSCLAGQVMDSVVFFPLAFGSIPNWRQVMVVGLVSKVVMSVPFLVLFLADSRVRVGSISS